MAAEALMSKLGAPPRQESKTHCPDECPARADDRPRRRSTQRHGRDYPFDDIRDAIRAVMRLSFHRLVQRGYAPDGAQTVLLRMTRGIVSHLDDEQRRKVG